MTKQICRKRDFLGGSILKRDQKGFTLIELLVVIAIIGVLAAMAIPVFAQYKFRAHDAESKTELHNIFLTCKAYWLDNGSSNTCSLATISSDYGYVQSSNITVTLTGDENTLNSSATSADTGNTFYLNPTGKIN